MIVVAVIIAMDAMAVPIAVEWCVVLCGVSGIAPVPFLDTFVGAWRARCLYWKNQSMNSMRR